MEFLDSGKSSSLLHLKNLEWRQDSTLPPPLNLPHSTEYFNENNAIPIIFFRGNFLV